MPLQAFVDDSREFGAPGFVLGGYIASVEDWERFSIEWQRVLDMPMRIEYFNMNEAYRIDGQFRHWSEPRRDERLSLFYDVIERHIPAAISCVIPIETLKSVVRSFDFPSLKGNRKLLENPYYLALPSLITLTAKYQDKMQLNEKIDFIFDEQVMEEDKIHQSWSFFKKNFPPALLHNLSGHPIFRNDKELKPLQAADLWAWVTRKRYNEKITGDLKWEPPWRERKPIHQLHIEYDERSIRALLNESLSMFRQ